MQLSCMVIEKCSGITMYRNDDEKSPDSKMALSADEISYQAGTPKAPLARLRQVSPQEKAPFRWWT